jgi:pimeloyl-ACP methyl ester carboxylesterase
MDYKSKYYKYKMKYLNLKKSNLNQVAGGTRHLKNMTGSSMNSINKNILISEERGLEGTIEWANSNAEKYFDDQIEKSIWGLKKNVSNMKFKLEDVEADIDFNLFHLRNIDLEEDSKPLIVLPGYSSDSLGMTLTRTSKFKNVILSKGFSDIYVFDFTGIGGRKKDKPEDPGFEIQALVKQYPSGINRMYEIISQHLANFISQNFNNFSILGRSAGGGLSMQMVFLHGLNPVGLNLASPGYSFKDIEQSMKDYPNKDLPIRICWAKEDLKNPEVQEDKGNDGKNLRETLNNSSYTNMKYYSVSVGSENDKLTHRILPELLKNLS